VFQLHSSRINKKVNAGDIKRAIRLIRSKDTRTRFATVLKPLIVPLSPEKQAEAERQWRLVASYR
jgi:uncharacterized Fe-S cluster-containing MiaB family protein